MVDFGCPEIAKTLHTRLNFYESKQWNVQYILFANNQMKKIDKQIALDILEGR